MNQDPFKEYIRESEPNKREKSYAWQTAIGLQAVDGLKTSKYLIDTANDIFAENAWYFRNALVRANYNNFKIGVHETTEYLELFLRNLLLNEQNELYNRVMHISGKFVISPKENVDYEKANIEKREVNDENIKANIREQLGKMLPDLSEKTMEHILCIYEAYEAEESFGRKDIMLLTGLKATRASEVIKLLTRAEVVEAVKGRGKGKYCFIKELSGKPDYEGSVKNEKRTGIHHSSDPGRRLRL